MSCLKVAIIGAPSSRKTTACVGIEAYFKKKGINCETSKEFAREYIAKYGVPKDLVMQWYFLREQSERDESIARSSQVLLTDTPPMGSYLYGMYMLKTKDLSEQSIFLKETLIPSLQRTLWFDKILVFPPREVVNDGVRVQTTQDCINIHDSIIGFLKMHHISYTLVSGEDQTEKCIEIIEKELEARNNAQENQTQNS